MEPLEKNIRKLYWFKALSQTGFFLPIIVLFWQDNGLSMAQVMLLQSIFAILVVILEVPTGYLADVWGRKKSLVTASVALSLAFIGYTISGRFWQFAIIEACFAAGIALMSGSDSALLYDSLKALGRESAYKRTWGNTLFYLLLVGGASNIIGGLIGQISFRLTFIVTIPLTITMLIIGLSFKEPKRHKPIIKKGYLQELLSILAYAMVKNKRLKWLIIYTGIIYAFYQSALWFYQPYFSLAGLDIVHFGIIFASYQVFAAFSARNAARIEKAIGRKGSMVLVFGLVVTSFLLMGNFIHWFSFTFGFLHQFIRGFFKVVVSDYVNAMTDSAKRATVLSIQNMFSSLLYAVFIPLPGIASDHLGLALTLTLIGALAFLVGGPVLLVLHRKRLV